MHTRLGILKSKIPITSLIFASLLQFSCRTTDSSSGVLNNSANPSANGVTTTICHGNYDGYASQGALDSEVQTGRDPAKVTTIFGIEGDRVAVVDTSFPNRSHTLQDIFADSGVNLRWKRDAFSNAGLPDPGVNQKIYQSPCLKKGSRDDYSVTHCDATRLPNFALLPDGNITSGGKGELIWLRRESRAPHEITNVTPVISYTCDSNTGFDFSQSIETRLSALREFFTVRNARGQIVVAPVYPDLTPLGTAPDHNFKKHVDGRGTFAPDYNSPIGLLREQLYLVKATRNAAGLTPREQFFEVGQRQYHVEVNGISRADSRRREYGMMSAADAEREMNTAIAAFDAAHPVHSFDAKFSKRPTAAEAQRIFKELIGMNANVAVGTFGGAKDECNKAASVFVFIINNGATKMTFPLGVHLCPPP